MRVVLDAKVAIAAAASRGLCEAIFELCLAHHHIVPCEGLLAEVTAKLRRKLRLPHAVVEEYDRLLRDHAEFIQPHQMKARVCRDPADDMLLGLVVAGRVDVIVSGDKVLLVLQRFETARIITPRIFREFVEGGLE